MNQETYCTLTETTRRIVRRLPFGEGILKMPTILCGCVYLWKAVCLLRTDDRRLFAFLAAPALCFLTVTLLRKGINRTRPYDAYRRPPVGKHQPGKGKSMPSRHAASAAAILMALLWLQPPVPAAVLLVLLTLIICLLRIAAGQHYPSDVAAGVLLSVFLSLLLLPGITRLIP